MRKEVSETTETPANVMPTSAEPVVESIDARRAALQQQLYELDVEASGTVFVKGDAPYEHGMNVPQDVPRATIEHLKANALNLSYIPPEMLHGKYGVPSDMTYMRVRKAEDFKQAEGVDRVEQIRAEAGDRVKPIEGCHMDFHDLRTIMVPKAWVAEKQREEVERQRRHNRGERDFGSDVEHYATPDGYVHTQFPDGNDPGKKTREQLWMEHQQNVQSGLIDDRTPYKGFQGYKRLVNDLPIEDIEREETHYRGNNRHQNMSQKQFHDMVREHSERQTSAFAMGNVGFGPQSRTERQQSIQAAKATK